LHVVEPGDSLLRHIVGDDSQFFRLEPHADRLSHQHGHRSLGLIAHVKLEFHAREGQRVSVDEYPSEVERIVHGEPRPHVDDDLRPVVDGRRGVEAVVIVHHLGIAEDIFDVLGHVHVEWQRRPALHFGPQGVGGIGAKESPCLVNAHPVAGHRAVVGSLIHVDDGLAHIDISSSFPGGLAVECPEQFCVATEIGRNLGHGSLQDLSCVARVDDDFGKHHHRWLEHYLEILGLPVERNLLGAVSHVRQRDASWHLSGFQHEVSVGIGDGRDMFLGYGNADVRDALACVFAPYHTRNGVEVGLRLRRGGEHAPCERKP